jgi:hypothetical protein
VGRFWRLEGRVGVGDDGGSLLAAATSPLRAAQHRVTMQEEPQPPGKGHHPLTYRHLREHVLDEVGAGRESLFQNGARM